MSLLHRQLLASAFQEMMAKFEPIVKDTLETAAAIVTPAAAPAIDAVIEVADKVLMPSAAPGAITSDHVAAAVAASSAPSAATAPPAPAAVPAASAPPAAAPGPNLAAGPAAAAIAACDALSLQLANLATQVAALRSNVTGSSGG